MTTIAPRQVRTSFDNYKLGLSGGRSLDGRSSRRISSSVRTSVRSSVRKPANRKGEQASIVKQIPTWISKVTKRQLFIIVLVAISVLAILLPATSAFGRLSLESSERPSAEAKSSVISVTVGQGDTLWSIARQLEPNRDPREIVDQLVQARGTVNVYAGETIEWTR